MLLPKTSTLFSRTINFCDFTSRFETMSEIEYSFSSSEAVTSSRARTIEASFIFLYEREMPIFSTSSEVSRRPAVSIKRNNVPSMVIVSSMVSRVVPAMSETMARSSQRRAFRRVLLPALTAPTMATGTPLRSALP